MKESEKQAENLVKLIESIVINYVDRQTGHISVQTNRELEPVSTASVNRLVEWTKIAEEIILQIENDG